MKLKNEWCELIHLGAYGFYPLFKEEWLDCHHGPLNFEEEKRAKEIFYEIGKIKNLQKKIQIITQLSHLDRSIFIKTFLKLVEHKMQLEGRNSLQ